MKSNNRMGNCYTHNITYYTGQGDAERIVMGKEISETARLLLSDEQCPRVRKPRRRPDACFA
jgi:hypothetical protein